MGKKGRDSSGSDSDEWEDPEHPKLLPPHLANVCACLGAHGTRTQAHHVKWRSRLLFMSSGEKHVFRALQ